MMGTPRGVGPLLGGFGSTTASLDVAEWIAAWPGNASTITLLNQTGAVWTERSANMSQYPAGPDDGVDAHGEPVAMKAKNWPALLILIIIFLTIGGNILVIMAVSMEKKLQNATNFFLRSLAVADMLVGILVMPISLINILYDYVWPLRNELCPIWIYLDVLFSTASIMHLCAISLDRYVAIRNPIEHSRFNSRTKAMIKIAVVWTISIGISMPIPVIGLHNQDKVFVNGSCVMNEERFMLVGSFVAFFIPLVIMVVTYCLTIQVLQRQATVFLYEGKTSSSQQPLNPPSTTSSGPPPGSATSLPSVSKSAASSVAPSRRSSLNCLRGAVSSGPSTTTPCSDTISIIPSSEAPSQLNSPATGRDSAGGGSHGSSGGGRRGMMQAIKNERRASKVLGVVFFLFLVMWCPFFVTNVLFVLCHQSCSRQLLEELLKVFVWVGYISSGVNPLVYTLFNKTYRRAFSRYLRCRYRPSGANGGGALLKPVPLHVVPCPPSSHAVTPVLLAKGHGGGGEGAGVGTAVDRNSNCKNGDGSALRNLELDRTDDDGVETGLKVGPLSQLSVNSCHAPRQDTSSV
ncbi:5-hydroxytryptamine (serotonin) receptor 2C, G protein-coupled-like 1 [Alosa sapidissima]|uniref:5-hydroxytryptamine (serotonin) receptor 2C, G protein-coupled-like 1 n=1 Tax=Alosa sapidissima TaxID=34773 RepID=UPI001C084684|nr:5-hydroxytryptamine (serotonin) receptor 2C, G protein-coupled-like 1 [Alosa sapidissima]XP_041925682.1 5-hydroxytryptamine (serotonin) receptor 2C, G protein-coupled-like 1 [Alosa sapidissima]XP_041925683.1 5-hydroxytryptamine (serotonin) receptor 2C, G protein-coupled-like 1 [Alosa sapidissima]